MSNATWTVPEQAHLLYLVQQGKEPIECWQIFQDEGIDRTQKAIQRRIESQRKKAPDVWRATIDSAPAHYRKLEQAMCVEAERSLILFDAHAPRHDAVWMNRVVSLALRWGVTDCILGGDLIDWDALSYFGSAMETDATEELACTEQILDALLSSFEVWYINGNHEDRIKRLLGHKLPATALMRLYQPLRRTDKIHLSNLYWCELVSAGQSFYVEHPQNTSVVATRVGQAIAAKYHKHVIMGHNHLWGMTKDVSGDYLAIEGGICADPQRIPYSVVRHNTRPAMCQGAVMVIDGQPWLLAPDNIEAFESLALAA